jgi:deoxyribodipyrimidine photo-lyase
MTVLLWFRNDLRLHDHQPLYEALRQQQPIVPIYCIDPRQFGTTSFGFPKTGPYRAQFLLQSLADLRQSLRNRGSDLVIRQGCPEKVIPALAQELKATAVYWHADVTAEELAVEQALEEQLKSAQDSAATLLGSDPLPSQQFALRHQPGARGLYPVPQKGRAG